MKYEVPTVVSLTVRKDEKSADFYRRALMEVAKLAGLPLLDQESFANCFIALGWVIHWRDNDPTLADDKTIKDYETKNRTNQTINYWLSATEIDELTQRQLYYQLNGGVLGSNREVSYNETIVVDLNIVYDPDLITVNAKGQSQVEYIQQNLELKLRYWTQTLSKINLDYTVRYTKGTCDSERKKITSGMIDGMADIFYLNDPKSLKAYARTEPRNDCIFFCEFK